MYWLPREKVLVPTDFSSPSLDAIHSALAMVEAGSNVHVLHVVEPLPEDLAAVELPEGLQLDVSEETRREHCHERLRAFLADQQVDGLTTAVETGESALGITRYARDNDIDLIVIAAHGYERGERISIGSVTERVLHNADCPVLVLRPDGRVTGAEKVHVRRSAGYSPAECASRDTSMPVAPR